MQIVPTGRPSRSATRRAMAGGVSAALRSLWKVSSLRLRSLMPSSASGARNNSALASLVAK